MVWLPALILSLGYIAVLCWLASQRIFHPFELEWMEGGSLQHLARLAAGQPLYPAPTIDFVPFPYPPLYYHVASWLGPVFGVSFVSLRAVSFASTLGILALIIRFVRREGGDRTIAWIAAGFFAATYRASGAYMDVGRLDSLFVFLLLASALLLRTRRDIPGLVLAGFAAFLATWTKQTGLVALGPLLLWCAVQDHREHAFVLARWRRTLLYGSAFGVPLAIATLLTNRDGSDHFLFYILGAQSGHEVRWDRIPGFFAGDLFLVLPVPVLALIFSTVMKRSGWSRSSALFYGALTTGILLACIVPRIKVGGALNNLIPIHACLAILGGVAISKLIAPPEPRAWLKPVLAVAVVGQLLISFYDPRITLPDASDLELGRRVVKRLASTKGEVLIPAQGYLASMAGKRVYAHQMPVDDLSRSGLAEAEDLRATFVAAIAARRFAIIIDSTSRFLRSYPNDRVLLEHYRVLGPVSDDAHGLVPRSGWQVGPGDVWVPKE